MPFYNDEKNTIDDIALIFNRQYDNIKLYV